MKAPQDIVIRPIITEHSVRGLAERKYTFEVAKSATKIEIAQAVASLFDVKVEKVRTLSCKGRSTRFGRSVGFRPDWKKAIVTLVEGSKTIEFFEGLF